MLQQKNVVAQEISPYGVGTLNLSQEMSDKMKNESGQFNYIIYY